MNLESYPFTLNKCLVIGKKFNYKEGLRIFALLSLWA